MVSYHCQLHWPHRLLSPPPRLPSTRCWVRGAPPHSDPLSSPRRTTSCPPLHRLLSPPPRLHSTRCWVGDAPPHSDPLSSPRRTTSCPTLHHQLSLRSSPVTTESVRLHVSYPPESTVLISCCAFVLICLANLAKIGCFPRK
jgi:hypothetical protein